MAKRFTDTDKWKDEWFCNLTATQKLLWFYICDECDGAGVWKVNLKLASFCIGVEVVTADLAAFEWGKRIIDLGNGRLWITGFLKFQYTTLSPKNKAHIGMMRTIVRDIGSLPLEGETKNLVQSFRDIANRPSVDSQESLDSASCEGRLTPQVKVKVKVKASSSEGGAGETKPSLTQAPLEALFSTWLGTLKHFKIERSLSESEKLEIARATQRHGTEITDLALYGARYEAKTDNFDPRQHVSIQRVLKPDRNGVSRLDKFANLGAANQSVNKPERVWDPKTKTYVEVSS